MAHRKTHCKCGRKYTKRLAPTKSMPAGLPVCSYCSKAYKQKQAELYKRFVVLVPWALWPDFVEFGRMRGENPSQAIRYLVRAAVRAVRKRAS